MNAIITGVGRRFGIGAGIARMLAKMKTNVFLTSFKDYDIQQGLIDKINTNKVYNSIVDECKGFGVKATFKSYDLTNYGDVVSLFDEANKFLGNIDILITSHCCHIYDEFGRITVEHLDDNLAVNAKATFLLCQEFYNRFNGEFGRIVSLSSTQGLEPLTTEVAYAISKATIPILVLTIAPILAKKNITINAVNPGYTSVNNNINNEEDYYYQSLNTMGRVGTPEDVSNIISFLVSDKGKWITGQTINSEGGLFRKTSSF